MKTVFLRVLEERHNKQAALLSAIDGGETPGRRRFEVDCKSFASVPRSPFAYWVSENLRRLFRDLPLFESAGRSAQRALSTNNDFRHLRLCWERLANLADSRPASGWFPFAKGGVFSPFYADIYLLVNWVDEGREIEAEAIQKFPYLKGNAEWVLHRECRYLQPGLTWPLRTKSELSLRVLPSGCIFGHKGPAAFAEDNNVDELLALLAVGNSKVFRSLVEFQLAAAEPVGRGGTARSYEVGVLQRTPVPQLRELARDRLGRLARTGWALTRSLDARNETSHAFALPVLLHAGGSQLGARATAWLERVLALEQRILIVQAEIDEVCFGLFGITDADRRAMTEGFGLGSEKAESKSEGDPPELDIGEDVDEDDVDEVVADTATLVAELVSWAAGVAFGRFDIRLATGERPIPPEPEPFDPLPTCSPGMLTGEDGLPLPRPPAGYPLSFPENGILLDDPGHPQDLVTSLRAVFDIVFGASGAASAHRWWNDVSALLDPKNHDLRSWLAHDFFEYHLKRYSKSRRKAPILWQLTTRSARYSVWLYAHRLTRDTFFQLQNDVVGPKLRHEDRQLNTLIQRAGGSPSAGERKEIAAQESFVDELRALLDDIQRVAPLWNPNLDDGVVLTMAPLWRLVPQHKPWQKELRSKWDELCAGTYDWAHLAMHLWPERVVPKCATDRSLAIAHGLEEAFWAEGPDGKWKARSEPLTPPEELIRERTSPAVKAALKSLLEAPTPGGAGKRARKGRTDA